MADPDGMNIVIDMNLSPEWCAVFRAEGWDAIHWSDVGANNAPDKEILGWARLNRSVVFTHDLDFSAILAATNADAPSVIQMRWPDVLPDTHGKTVVNVIREHRWAIDAGALLVIDQVRARVRVLPLE